MEFTVREEIEIQEEFKLNIGDDNEIRILISYLLIKMVAIYLKLYML